MDQMKASYALCEAVQRADTAKFFDVLRELTQPDLGVSFSLHDNDGDYGSSLETPLSVAAKTGQRWAIRPLLQRGFNPTYHAKNYQSAVRQAAALGDIYAVALLLEHHKDFLEVLHDKDRCIEFAPPISKYFLLDHRDDFYVLQEQVCRLCGMNDPARLTAGERWHRGMILNDPNPSKDSGNGDIADPLYCDILGFNCCHIGILAGSSTSGNNVVDCNHAGFRGLTPLILLALRWGKSLSAKDALVSDLLNHGANVHAVDLDGNDALSYAQSNRIVEARSASGHNRSNVISIAKKR